MRMGFRKQTDLILEYHFADVESVAQNIGKRASGEGDAADRGAIQSDAALRQSTEGRQMAAATLSVGVLLAILEVAPEIRVPFRVDSHHSSKLGGKSQGGRRDRNQPYRESPQRECITLDRTPPTVRPSERWRTLVTMRRSRMSASSRPILPSSR
jgi:hypothetical protein